MARPNIKGTSQFRLARKKLKEENNYKLFQKTVFLEEFYDNVSYQQRSWHFRNNIFSAVFCCCGKPASFLNKRYKSCSAECSSVKYSLKMKEFFLKNGIKSIFELPGVKEKIKKTCIEKYGVVSPLHSKEIQNKIKDGLFKTHGVNNQFQLKHVKEKIKQTCQIKYGVDHHTKHPDVKNKKIKTTKERYGVEWVMQDPSIKERARINFINKYGPSAFGSGSGWSGWYKGWFFRSLKELSMMILFIERFRFEWKSCDRTFITYFIDGKVRKYFPDFLLNDKYLIEVKPKKLWNNEIVQLKKKAAEVFCNKNGLKFKMIDAHLLSFDILKNLYTHNIIRFTQKSEIKFINWSLIHDKHA